LQTVYRYEVVERNFAELDGELHDLYFFIKPGKITQFVLNRNLSEKEKRFILVREIAYSYLHLRERFSSFRPVHTDSFEQLYNNFKASYFASAFLLPMAEFTAQVRHFFARNRWSDRDFLRWIDSCPCPPESFFHRFLQLLPEALELEQIFFLKFKYAPGGEGFQLERELHLSELHSPHRVASFEDYCRRWMTIQQLKQAAGNKLANSNCRIQRSNFIADHTEYLCISLVRPRELTVEEWECYCLGIAIDERLSNKMKFLGDPAIKTKEVGTCCQQCDIAGCAERVAPSYRQRHRRNARFAEALKKAMGFNQP
jgi:hypothetical protein